MTLRKPSGLCWDQMFLQGWAALLTPHIKTVRATEYGLSHRCCEAVGVSLVQPWSGLELLRKPSENPVFCWNKPEADVAGELVLFAQPVPQNLLGKRRHQVTEKFPNKATDEYRRDQTFSSVAHLWKEPLRRSRRRPFLDRS